MKVKIKNDERNKVTFGSLEVGDFFRLSSHNYLKVDNVGAFNAFDLNESCLVALKPLDTVILYLEPTLELELK